MLVKIWDWITGNIIKVVFAIVVVFVIGAGVVYGMSAILNALNAPRQITATVILERIQALSELSTVKYNFSSLVTTKRDMPGILAALYGESQAMVAVGHVRAGIDLSQMKEEDIVRGQDVLLIKLPPPVLLDCVLNESESYIVSRETGIFARNAPDLDTTARSYAIEQFRDAALNENILDEANHQTEITLEGFLTLIEPENMRIEIVTVPPDPDAPLPDTCQ